MEFFIDKNDNLYVNEIAPRVHNSGHLTINAYNVSQFENHVRGILGLPLGDPSARGHSAMVNLLGAMPELSALLEIQGVHVHDYGKSPRSLRKIGHCTLVCDDQEIRDSELQRLLELAATEIE